MHKSIELPKELYWYKLKVLKGITHFQGLPAAEWSLKIHILELDV